MKLSFGRKSLAAVFAGAFALVAIPKVDGQEEVPPAVPQTGIIVTAVDDGSGAGQVMSFSTLSSPHGAIAPVFMAGAGGMSFGTPNSNSMLFDRQIQQELEIVDDQVEQLRQIQQETQQQISERLQSMRSADGNFQFGEGFQQAVREIQESSQERYREVLLPHQLDRLKELQFHMKMRNQGEVETLGEVLDLTDEEVEELRERAQEIQERLEEEVRKLKLEAKEELFSGLTREQQEKLKELTGSGFVYEQEDMARQIRRQRQQAQDSARENPRDR